MDALETMRGRGLRLTPQRRLVYAALAEHPGHATADQLCSAISLKVPGFQRTTVYRTLDLLVELGLARRVQLGHASAYEAVRDGSDLHQHLVCELCGSTTDIRVPQLLDGVRLATAQIGFELQQVELVGHGLCRACTLARASA